MRRLWKQDQTQVEDIIEEIPIILNHPMAIEEATRVEAEDQINFWKGKFKCYIVMEGTLLLLPIERCIH